MLGTRGRLSDVLAETLGPVVGSLGGLGGVLLLGLEGGWRGYLHALEVGCP